MSKVWILTSSFGSGHRSAAKYIGRDLANKGYDVVIDDVVELCFGSFSKYVFWIFENVICKIEFLYKFLNGFGRRSKKFKRCERIFRRYAEVRPDFVVTTWAGCSRILKDVDCDVYVWITDFGVHEGWLCPIAKGYVVMSDFSKDRLCNFGVDESKVFVKGLPISDMFYFRKRVDDVKRVVVMGGGLGIMPWVYDFLKGFSNVDNVEISVLTGKNVALAESIEGRFSCVKFVGFSDRPYEFLGNADLVITKAGGISLYECISCLAPVLIVGSNFCQESENIEFVLKNGFGALSSYDDLYDLAVRYLFDDVWIDDVRQRMFLFGDSVDNGGLFDF